jgi:hypothetical protein
LRGRVFMGVPPEVGRRVPPAVPPASEMVMRGS